MASLLGKSWLLLAFRAALCGEQALMKEKRLSSWLLLVSRCTEPSWRARAKRGEARGSWCSQRVARQGRKEWGCKRGETSIWFRREIQSPVCQPVQEDNQRMAYGYSASGVPLAISRPLCSPYLQDLEKQKHVPAQIFSQRRSWRQKSHPVGSLQQVTALLLQGEEKRLRRSRLCLTSFLCNSFRRR